MYLKEEDNFLAIPEKNSNYSDSGIVIIQAPLEQTVSYGKGTGNGPAKLIEASHFVEFYDEELDRELCFEKGICTLESLKFSDEIEKNLELISTSVREHLDAGKFVVTIGGEHSLTQAPLKVFNEKFENLSVLQIDAHSDFRDSYEGSKFSHASVMARIAEFNKKIVQAGIRAQCSEEAEFIRLNNISTFYMRDIRTGKHGNNWIEKAVSSLTENVYITFDVDGLDPSVIPATGTPEPGGLLWDETLDLLRLTGEKKNIVGIDLVELAPKEDDPYSDFTSAKLLYKMLNYAFINK